MIILFISIVLLGVIIGIITGLMPGIHINLVASFIAFILPLMAIDPLIAVILILSISITHIFLDFIPTTFLGVPTPDNSTFLLPSHELLLKGRAYEAIFLSTFGCLIGIILVSAVSPLLSLKVEKAYALISEFIPYLLIAALLVLLLKEKDKAWAFIVVFMSAIFGIVSFGLSIKEALFPMFSGLFGISSLIASRSYKSNIPEQKITKVKLAKKTPMLVLTGFFASLLVGFLPGLGPAQASIIATSFSKNQERKDYIIITAAINSIVMILAVIALFTINKSRNGAIAIISEIFPKNLSWQHFALFLAVILFASGIAAIATIFTAKYFVKISKKVNYAALSISVIAIIVILVLLLSKLAGLLILFVGTSIGLIPILKKVSRNHLMACLIVPIILYYLL